MTLQAPNLDSRSFDDLVREAKERIPLYSEWTNFNKSDPGMTLVELHAWMTETILYELNRVPELNYIKFLDLLDIKALPAQPALTDLSFTLAKLDKPDDVLTVAIPKGAVVAVDDPDLAQDIVFETDRTLTAINAHVGAAFVHSSESGQTRKLITKYEDVTTWTHTFRPFSTDAAKSETFYLGILLRPVLKSDISRYSEDSLPTGTFNIYVDSQNVFDNDADFPKDPESPPVVFEGPLSHRCENQGDAGLATHIRWQVYTGDISTNHFADDSDDTGWTDINVSRDETLELSRSGHIGLEIPPGASAINPLKLSKGFWDQFGQTRPPQTHAEFMALLVDPNYDILPKLSALWETLGVSGDSNGDGTIDLDEIAACGEDANAVEAKIATFSYELKPDELTVDDWISIAPDLVPSFPMAEGQFRDLYWIRARIQQDFTEDELKPGALSAFRLNTVSATQAASRLDEELGRSSGSPSQTFKLAKSPVLITPSTGTPDIVLNVGTSTSWESWERVTDFYNSAPDSKHFQINPESGVITFGDGRRGSIPVADARITAKQYRYGGGEIGNVGPHVITKVRGRIRNVKSVTNFRAAHNGSDSEPIEDVKLRAPHELRGRDRAMSAEDFRDLAMRTPGVNLHKAVAISRSAVDDTDNIVPKDGAVTLVVLPKSDHETPQPSNHQLRAVCQWLEPRRLVTTELHVTGPKYARIFDLKANIQVFENFDLSDVTSRVYEALLSFLSPISGGKDKSGWPFGEDIYHADVYDIILAVEGVRRASHLAFSIEEGVSSIADDITTLAAGYLPTLSRDVIDLAVTYG